MMHDTATSAKPATEPLGSPSVNQINTSALANLLVENSFEYDQLIIPTDQETIHNSQVDPPLNIMAAKKAIPKYVIEVRRSKRLADLTARYKTEEAKDKAEEKTLDKPKKKKKSKNAKDLTQEFEAEVIDTKAPPPPELPLQTIQAIATKQCHVAPSEVIEECLNSTCG
jgi:hypothetical protein